MLELALRLVFSLAVVLGLLILIARFGARRFRGGKDSLVHVVHRQHLTRGSSVSVVTVGSRVLVLGTTEHQISVLAELDPEEIADLDAEPAAVAEVAGDPGTPAESPAPLAARTVATGPLSGSLLSADTWRQALAAATRRAS